VAWTETGHEEEEEQGQHDQEEIISSGRRERMKKTARARRAEADADALWTEVYRPRSPDEVCGNAMQMAALSKWLGEWKEKRKRGRGGDRAGPSPGSGEDSGEESEYDWVRFSDDEEDGDARLCNMAMLCGPPGVGKTSAVYGCAKALGYEVIEVNPSQLRSGAAIRRLFGEATQSHHVSSAETSSKPGTDGITGGRKSPSLDGLFPSDRAAAGGRGRGRG
ncbi:unnamed protein product, partial [Ectocarpus sp. 12 AP-2014]